MFRTLDSAGSRKRTRRKVSAASASLPEDLRAAPKLRSAAVEVGLHMTTGFYIAFTKGEGCGEGRIIDGNHDEFASTR